MNATTKNPMRLHVISDLHLEFEDMKAPRTNSDVIVLPGDISLHTKGLDWASRQKAFRGKPIIYVPGNHEYYGAEYIELRRALYALAADLRSNGCDLHILDCDALQIGAVRFLGATLWTDYLLYGEAAKPMAMLEARRMNDHRLIQYAGGRGQLDNYSQRSQLFLPEHAERLHQQARSWLADSLGTPHTGKTVVITHHLPSRCSVATRFENDLLSASFASDMDALIPKADLWIHGHTHDAFDYHLDKCRIVCNPRGYPREYSTNFNPDLVIEV